MQNPWVKQENKIKVESKLPKCAADSYFNPSVNKVITKIESDDDDYVPRYDKNSSCAKLLANTSRLVVEPNGIVSIDCGFSIECSQGYKACVSVSNGFILASNNNNFIKSRVSFSIINATNNKIIINDKDVIGQIWVEPIYFFEWEKS